MSSQSTPATQFALLQDALISQLYGDDAIQHRHILSRINALRMPGDEPDSEVLQCNTLSPQSNDDNLATLQDLSAPSIHTYQGHAPHTPHQET